MIKNILISFIIFSSLCLRAEIALYTPESDNPRPVSDMYTILQGFAEKQSDRNILFYVHGRKRNVETEIARMKKIEAIYNVDVVMLHWDSYSTLLTRPIKNAEIAADSLHDCFEDISRFEIDHQAFFNSHNISLLTHSMGNLILKDTVEKFYFNELKQEKIFSNIISVGADVPLKGHSEWLSKLQLAKQNYIMMNNRDIVLLSSYILDLTAKNPFSYRLGLGFDNYIGWKDNIKNKLVQNTNYIDLSDILIMDHGYFLNKHPVMKFIFNNLINGNDFKSNEKDNYNLKYKLDRNEKNIIRILK